MNEMSDNTREFLAREAAEAESAAREQAAGERPPAPGARGRAAASDASQVYSIRIPVNRLEQLRQLAAERAVAPTALMRQFVLERLDREAAPMQIASMPERDPDQVRIGPSRNAAVAEVVSLRDRRAL
jgi:chemotaxis protein histidine kinase CheA